ncbi:GntR family transcriptional regulator [Teredinibacter haidensis]|uniref:GntR family transcriptional regulator n=1 Tax=Teredinibacter haidensis TaxID=2731755 RepID=UPI00094890FC|nr:GntR family transcriptional regulator [Teredinibacter haidensis]
MTTNTDQKAPNNPQPISYNLSTPNQLFEYIRDEIVGMVLVPGEKIPENQLAQKFGVSRTPVRAALAKLASLGFVEVRPQRGTFVTKLSMQSILEARFLREAIEVAVASFLAEHPNTELIEECENIIEKQIAAAKNEDALAFQHLDDQFHITLSNATGFTRVSQKMEAEKAHMDRVRNLSLVELTGQYDHVIQQHKAILKAIKTGSADNAKKAMEAHMKDVFNILKIAPEKHPEFFI